MAAKKKKAASKRKSPRAAKPTKRATKKTTAKKSATKRATVRKTPSKGKPRVHTKATRQARAESAPTQTARSNANPGELLKLTRHRELALYAKDINARLNSDPDLAIMAFINPVLALNELGVKMSTEVRHHILSNLRHTPALRARRAELEQRLNEALGENPTPQRPQWLARILFDKLKLRPLDTQGAQPNYKPVFTPEQLAPLQKLRPPPRNRYIGLERKSKRRSSYRVEPRGSTVRRLDLDAPAPKLPPAKRAPSEVGLEELYFYKDMHPLARDLLEFGILQRRGVRWQSGDTYRRIKAGETKNAWRSWLTSVRFGEESE